MHFTETDTPMIPARAYFAVAVEDWAEMLSHLEALGQALPHKRDRSGPGRAIRRIQRGEDWTSKWRAT